MRVTLGVRLDAGLLMGGGEIQALATQRALAALGVEVAIHGPLDVDLGDIVHFFGLMDDFPALADQVRRRQVPYVVSPIFIKRRPPSGLGMVRLRHRLTNRYPKEIQRFLARASAIYVNSTSEEQRILEYFGDDLPSIQIVPSGVDPEFWNASPDRIRSQIGHGEPYLLHVGTYASHKNQLQTVAAAKALGMLSVFIGRRSDDKYLDACRRAGGRGAIFLENLAHDDPLLASAYAGASIFCLPSNSETFCLAALEAAAAGLPIVLSNTWDAQTIYGDDAEYVDPRSVESIHAGIERALRRPRDRAGQASRYQTSYGWPVIAESLTQSYRSIVEGS